MIKLSFPLIKSRVFLTLKRVRERTEFHFGIGNRCADGLYVVFLDYDDTPFEWIREEILLLQDRKELGSAYVFSTKHGYHVVFLSKVPLGVLIDCLDMTSIDKRYRSVPLRYASSVWVLRQTEKKDEKIIYECCFPSNGGGFHEYSTAHRLYLEQYCGVPSTDFLHSPFWDDQKDIILGYYRIPEEP